MILGFIIGTGHFSRYSAIMEFPFIEITVDLYEGILITTSFACWVLIVSPSQSKKFLSISNFPLSFSDNFGEMNEKSSQKVRSIKIFILKLSKIKHMRVSRRYIHLDCGICRDATNITYGSDLPSHPKISLQILPLSKLKNVSQIGWFIHSRFPFQEICIVS